MRENISDYKEGTAYIKLPRSVFKDQTYFDQLLSFLKLPKDCKMIEVKVNQQYTIARPGGLSWVERFEQNYKGY